MSYSKDELRRLRNEIHIEQLIGKLLNLATKSSEGYFRYLCPLCGDFHTATNPRTNLARCFRCQRNFNPIDMVMLVRGCSFRAAVEYLRHFQRRCAAQQPERQKPAVPRRR